MSVKRKTNAGPYVSHWCKDAAGRGERESEWHGHCHLGRCTCPCHSDASLRTADFGAAADRREDLRARLVSAQAAGAAARAAARAYREERAEEVSPRSVAIKVLKRDQRVLRGTCHHCGQGTKGGIFIAGHDAKLKGNLKRLATLGTGDVEALAEILYREWPTPPNVPAEQLERAAEITTHSQADTWFEQRVYDRIQYKGEK